MRDFFYVDLQICKTFGALYGRNDRRKVGLQEDGKDEGVLGKCKKHGKNIGNAELFSRKTDSRGNRKQRKVRTI